MGASFGYFVFGYIKNNLDPVNSFCPVFTAIPLFAFFVQYIDLEILGFKSRLLEL